MDNNLLNNIETVAENFSICSKMLTAIGDETRQHLILEMMKMKNCNGMRVGEITEKTNLSRPAISHHLQIIKDAGILKVRKEVIKNYYYFEPDTQIMERLADTLNLVAKITKSLPDRSGENV